MVKSDRYQFTVVMPNLNYDVLQDVSWDVPQDKLDAQIMDLIHKDKKMDNQGYVFFDDKLLQIPCQENICLL